MKVDPAQRWKRKQHKLLRKYKTNVILKYKKKRDLSGKFVLLLNKSRTKCAAILKFLSRRLCRTEMAIYVDSNIIKQTRPKYIISPRQNWKLLRKIEVIVTRRFKEDFTTLHTTPRVYEKPLLPKKVAPLKIFSCPTCNHKFTNRKVFLEHSHSHTDNNASSDSEGGDLVIDDDVMLVLGDESSSPTSHNKHPAKKINLKADPDEAKGEKFCCMMDGCEKSFDTEQLLVIHIGLQHGTVESKQFQCKKCNDSFARESALLAHHRMMHPVEIIPSLPLPPPGRKSIHMKSVSPIKNGVSKVASTISFQRFDAKGNFTCRFCSGTFDLRPHLDRHMSVHHILRCYDCYKCGVSFYTANGLLKHLKESHLALLTDSGYLRTISNCETATICRCAFCGFTSKVRARVDEHMINEHYDEYEKSESHEDDHSSSPDSLDNMLLPENEKHLKSDDEDLLVEVSSKPNENSSLKKLSMKVRRKPKNDPSFQFRCARCLRRFAKSRTLKNHVCELYIKPVLSTNTSLPSNHKTITTAVSGFFRCKSCPQVFTDKANHDIHQSEVHAELPTRVSNTINFYGSSL